jgi:hypothetical protein
MPTDLPECIVTVDYAPLIRKQDSLVACPCDRSYRPLRFGDVKFAAQSLHEASNPPAARARTAECRYARSGDLMRHRSVHRHHRCLSGSVVTGIRRSNLEQSFGLGSLSPWRSRSVEPVQGPTGKDVRRRRHLCSQAKRRTSGRCNFRPPDIASFYD